MNAFKVRDGASHRLDEIYEYAREAWGEARAGHYLRGLFERFEAIAARRVPWRAVPAALGVQGFVCLYEKHFIHWKVLDDGAVGIVTVLHERMHQIDRFQDDHG